MAVSTAGSLLPNEDCVQDVMQNFKPPLAPRCSGASPANIYKNYVAIINPNTGQSMLHLKKYGECTLIDPRACINHYECAADVACILYATVSLRYFHYMVHSGYVSNRTRVVLNDTKNDTYVFMVAENLASRSAMTSNTVDSLMRTLQQRDGECHIGIDVLQAGDKNNVGYFFHQQPSYFRKGSKGSDKKKLHAVTSKVMTAKEWAKRLKLEKQHHDCQRRLYNESQKEQSNPNVKLRGLHHNPACDETSVVTHVPTLIIQSSDFNIVAPARV